MIDRAEIEQIVSLCWDVACHVPLEGIPLNDAMGKDESGYPRFHMVRWETYQILLRHMLPTYAVYSGEVKNTVEQHIPREPWQGEP